MTTDARGKRSPCPPPQPEVIDRAVRKVGPITPYALGALHRQGILEAA